MINQKFSLDNNLKYLVGCSGGPDSMFLLLALKAQNFKIIACHVNYDKRPTAYRDQKIMTDFCTKHNIKYYVLEMTADKYQKYQKITNFQNKARKIRFDFFKKIGDLENSDNLCLGHHKDDFLETAIWQEKIKKTKTNFYGIRSTNTLFGLHVFRPLMNYYKVEIIKYLNNNNIKYGIDESNATLAYTRNQIRNTLKLKTDTVKDNMVKYYEDLNQELLLSEIDLNNYFKEWLKTNFAIEFINNININKRKKLLFKYIYNFNLEVKLSNNKLNSICDFLEKKDHRKMYRIGNSIYLTKKRNLLAFISKK